MKIVFSGPAEAGKSIVLKIVKGGETVFEGTPSPTR
jgi:ABC-type iron transport system FetAB ATPase subunit